MILAKNVTYLFQMMTITIDVTTCACLDDLTMMSCFKYICNSNNYCYTTNCQYNECFNQNIFKKSELHEL